MAVASPHHFSEKRITYAVFDDLVSKTRHGVEEVEDVCGTGSYLHHDARGLIQMLSLRDSAVTRFGEGFWFTTRKRSCC